jgi:hypothetical protein
VQDPKATVEAIGIHQPSQPQVLLPIAGPLLPKQALQHARQGASVVITICTIVG